MKRKKRSQPSLTESLIIPVNQLAKDRGLDPGILERESLQYGFGYLGSGICNVDVVRYDQWISEQIRSGGADIEKPTNRKSLSEVLNPGVLNANLIRLSAQIKTDGTDLDWLNSQISKSPDGLAKKQLRVKKQRLEKKIDKKKTLIGVAEDQLNHLLDAELGEAEQPE